MLLEYMEESPLLLSRPGMGVRLTSYYRKRSPLDAGHQRLAQAHPQLLHMDKGLNWVLDHPQGIRFGLNHTLAATPFDSA